MSFIAIGQWLLKDMPLLRVGHALGLFLYASGIFVVVVMPAASLRTNVVVVSALAIPRGGIRPCSGRVTTGPTPP
jgi:hypothetical protein